MKKNVPFYEWTFLCLLTGAIFSILFISTINQSKAKRLVCSFAAHKLLKVEILGAVNKPGVYEFSPGVTYGTIFKKAKLDKFADTSNFNLTDRVFSSLQVRVSKLNRVQIYLSGAVAGTGPFEFELGSKLKDVKKLDVFLENSDLSVLKSRRLLKNKEELYIPYTDQKTKIIK